MNASYVAIALIVWLSFSGCSNTVAVSTLDSDRRVTTVEKMTPDEDWKRTEDRRIEAELAGRKPEGGTKTWRE